MALTVLGRPRLTAADAAWIRVLRDRHAWALRAPEIGPHVTLVFPTDSTDATTATGHLAVVAGEIAAFSLAFRCALPVADAPSGGTYIYLVPDEGFSTLVRLHDRLYSGPFADALRLDLPYIPHITLGWIAEARLARALADDLNGQEPDIQARLETVELFDLDPQGPARRLAEIALRG